MRIELYKEDKALNFVVQNAEDNISKRIADIMLLEIKLKELKEETLDAYSKGFTSYKEYKGINTNKVFDRMCEYKSNKEDSFLDLDTVAKSKVEFNLELLKGQRVVVNCVTQEQETTFINWVVDYGIDNYTTSKWYLNKKNSCYLLTNNLFWNFNCKYFFERRGYKIVSYEEALLKNKVEYCSICGEPKDICKSEKSCSYRIKDNLEY